MSFALGESVEDEPRESRPVDVVTDENIRRIEEELLSDRRLLMSYIYRCTLGNADSYLFAAQCINTDWMQTCSL
jgi:hypothetical protein